MTADLLALSIGPVQEFISAARRTRDLWFGSYLLSEISKAAAKAVQAHGGKLIFPAPSNDADLDRDSPLSVANVIVAELGEIDPAQVASEAKKATQERWRDFADDVLNTHTNVICSDIWKVQVDDVIEFYAAWHPYTPQTYRSDRAALMRLLAARKRCRDFLPAIGRAGVPKSSLDGLRESVLRDPREWPKLSHRRLRLNEGEQLDVVGMVKRTWAPAGKPQRYPSVERVAADSWLRKVLESPHFNELVRECGDLNLKFGGDVVQKLDTSARGHPQYALFPFEGTAAFRSRHREFCKEVELPHSDLEALTQALGKLTSKYGDPSPYLSVLVADGDRMGEALSQLGSPEEHRRFSRDLASFAAKARDIIDKHSGVLIYAGGDDLLAFVPLDRCLDCARELHDTFGGVLAEWSKDTESKTITLSVGVAIAHFMEPLEDLLEYGRTAEKDAKRKRPEEGQQERDGLAVHLVKRAGGKISVRANWQTAPDKHLMHLAGLIAAKAISGSVAYDLHKIAAVYDSWPEATVKNAIQRDALSVMQGKRPSGTGGMGEVNTLINKRVTRADSLRGLANELLVAKALNGEVDRS